MEFSKKIVICTGVIFMLTVIACVVLVGYFTINGIIFDWANITSIITIVGGAFTASITTYSVKAKMENIYKIKKSFLQEKYDLLSKAGMLTPDYAQQELSEEIGGIDMQLNEAELEAEHSDTTF